MTQFNYPTTILYGEGSLLEGLKRIKAQGFHKPLIVTDETLIKIGLYETVKKECESADLQPELFYDLKSNPVEEDVEKGAEVYLSKKCDSILAFGGGAPMDVAKVIAVSATHEGPLAKFDDAQGGDKYIVNPMPPIFAIPTTAGTGSEVGRSGVIIVRDTGLKTVIFHPSLLPKLAILEPFLTSKLPPFMTAATGIDAFTHSIEAYFSPFFHPMSDGIAVEGMHLVLKNLKIAFNEGENLNARAKMLLAASMGATAFQKGLGMAHSMAHPLSSECGLHHGLANALVLPTCVKFISEQNLNEDQKKRFKVVENLFQEEGLFKNSLAESIKLWIESFEIKMGLSHHGVKKDQITTLSKKAFLDICHQTNMVPVTESDFEKVFLEAF